jgi:Family of unknown function (DUF6194)
MNDVEMSQYITNTFKGVDSQVVEGNTFYFYNPDSNLPANHMFPFVTLMTNDVNDQFSNLNRPSVFRLNIGIGKETFRALFGTPVLPEYGTNSLEGTALEANGSDFDFTVLNQLLPHPVYGKMYWVCILNPSNETLETKVRPLLDEAYEMATGKFNK